MPDRTICLLEPVFWGFCGNFVEESIYAFTGHRFLNYITVTSMYQLDNEHIDPRNHFLVSSSQLIATQQHSWDKGRMLGIAHRHPEGFISPSQDDFDGLRNSLLGVVWCEGNAIWYDRKGELELRCLFS